MKRLVSLLVAVLVSLAVVGTTMAAPPPLVPSAPPETGAGGVAPGER